MILKGQTCTVEGIQASECFHTGKRIYTLLCEYPRFIHAQLLTHGVFSKNSSSSRAVPYKKAIEQVVTDPAKVIWTENKPGMQGPVITNSEKLDDLNQIVTMGLSFTAKMVEALADSSEYNVHKQNACRYLEPYQNIKVLITSTEWENWDWLRDDEEAQGEIADLARTMSKVRNQMEMLIISEDEWHVPFVDRQRDPTTGELCYMLDGKQITQEDAVLTSMSCSAQTSYRVLDTSPDKTTNIVSKLFSGRKVHASPAEHQATPIGLEHSSYLPGTWPKGVTHVNRHGLLSSGNFYGFIQNRQLLSNHDAAIKD